MTGWPPPRDWYVGLLGVRWRDGGRDRDGLDCWGLGCLLYRELLGEVLPLYAGDQSGIGRPAAIDALTATELARPCWREVTFHQPQPADLLSWFGPAGWRTHVSFWVRAGWHLEIRRGEHVRCCRLPAGEALAGAFRHEAVDRLMAPHG